MNALGRALPVVALIAFLAVSVRSDLIGEEDRFKIPGRNGTVCNIGAMTSFSSREKTNAAVVRADGTAGDDNTVFFTLDDPNTGLTTIQVFDDSSKTFAPELKLDDKCLQSWFLDSATLLCEAEVKGQDCVQATLYKIATTQETSKQSDPLLPIRARQELSWKVTKTTQFQGDHLCRIESAAGNTRVTFGVIYGTGKDGSHGNRHVIDYEGAITFEKSLNLPSVVSNPVVQINSSFILMSVHLGGNRFALVRDGRFGMDKELSMFEVEGSPVVPLLQPFSNNGYYITSTSDSITFHAFAFTLFEPHGQSHTMKNVTFLSGSKDPALYVTSQQSVMFVQGKYLGNNYRPGDPNPVTNIFQAHTTTESFNTIIPLLDQPNASSAKGPMAIGQYALFVSEGCGLWRRGFSIPVSSN